MKNRKESGSKETLTLSSGLHTSTVRITSKHVRVILDEADVSRQSIKTWKESRDPEFDSKKKRIDRLTHRKHNPPVVLSADEIGPVSLKPHGGMGIFPRGAH